MLNNSLIFKIIKSELKKQNIKYFDLCSVLNLSLPSVKRIFSIEEISLDNLILILNHLNLDLNDLQKQINSNNIKYFTLEQENIILSDNNLLLVTILVLNNLSFKEILEFYNIKETELISTLIKLENFKILKLLPHNIIKLNIDKSFSWIKNGPIDKYFKTHILQEFINENSNQFFKFGLISEDDFNYLNSQIKNLISNFLDCQNKTNNNLKLNNNYALFIDFKKWTPSFIINLKK